MFPDLCGNKDKGFSSQGIYPKYQMSTLVPFLHVDNIQFFILIQAYLVLESFLFSVEISMVYSVS